MYASRILRALATSSTSTLPRTLSELIPKDTANVLSNKPRTLYETLSRLPHDGVGARVHQTRWSSKGIEGCYWEVSRVKLKDEGKHGKAWGRLVWRGKPISEREERIRGSLKYMWAAGVSKGKNLRAFQEVSPLPVKDQLWEQQKARSEASRS